MDFHEPKTCGRIVYPAGTGTPLIRWNVVLKDAITVESRGCNVAVIRAYSLGVDATPAQRCPESVRLVRMIAVSVCEAQAEGLYLRASSSHKNPSGTWRIRPKAKPANTDTSMASQAPALLRDSSQAGSNQQA